MPLDEIIGTDVRKAAFHEASHGVVGSRFTEWVQICILPSELALAPAGCVAGSTRFVEIASPVEQAALAWAGFFGERLCDEPKIDFDSLKREAEEKLPEISELDWAMLESIPSENRATGAKVAYDILCAEWKTVVRQAEILIRFYKPPAYAVSTFQNGRWGG